jgi:quercetin dioxygenase-like cupin family protein
MTCLHAATLVLDQEGLMDRSCFTPTANLGLAALLASLGALACGDSVPPTPASPEKPLHGGPSFTATSGVTRTVIARGNLGAFHLQSKWGKYSIELKTHDDTDVEVRSVVAAPGSFSGWHTHPAPTLLVIKTGALTVYDATDSDCKATVHSAGTAFFEGTTPHNVRNEGTAAVEYGTLFFVPKDGPTRIEADFPPHCPP